MEGLLHDEKISGASYRQIVESHMLSNDSLAECEFAVHTES